MKKIFRYPLCLMYLLLFAGLYPLSAQWNNDPLQNLAIADTSGEQVLPKIQPTSDGGCYISWFDSRSGNYDVYLQRLNSLGEIQWDPKGLLISNHPQQSWLVDYDLAVDPDDNALLVFADIRNGGSSDLDIFAYKIAPDGSFLWGPDGIGLSDVSSSDFEAAPKVTATPGGLVAAVWPKLGDSDRAALQLLSADGQKLWGEFGITIQGTGDQSIGSPDLVPAGGDSVIAFWKNSTGPFWAPVTKLYTQKFAPDGSAAWNPGGLLIYDLGHIPGFVDPQIYPDGHGGAFYTWEDRPSLSDFNIGVGHVSAGGSLIFPLNGVTVSANITQLHLNPALSYLPQSDEVFVFWTEENINQNQYGIYGQKFSATGERLWSDNGKELIALGGNQISFIRSAITAGAVYVGYFQSSAPNAFDNAVKALQVDPDGTLLWGPLELSSASLGNKGRLGMMTNTEGRAFLTWSDDRHDSGDIYAQNVNPDGTLGNPPNAITGTMPPESFELLQNYPNPFNPETVIRYQLSIVSEVRLTVYNALGQKVETLVNETQSPGTYTLHWDGTALPAGLYFYEMSAGNDRATRKMILLK